jgi:hypothetical protein
MAHRALLNKANNINTTHSLYVQVCKKINFKIIQKFSFLLPKDTCNVVVLLEKRRTQCDAQAQRSTGN